MSEHLVEQLVEALRGNTSTLVAIANHVRALFEQGRRIEALLVDVHQRVAELELATVLHICRHCGARWRESRGTRSACWCPRCSKEVHAPSA